MITDSKKWHYLAIKSIPILLRGITSKNNGDFYCLNCFSSFRTKSVLKSNGNVCKDNDYCYLEMPNGENNILKYNLGEKSMEIPLIIYGDFESISKEISTCDNDPKRSSTNKISKHIPSGFSLFTYCSFDKTKNKLSYYRDKDCMKVFYKILKEQVERNLLEKKKEMMPLTDEENRSHENQKLCHVCRKLFTKDDKKVKDHCHFIGKYTGAAHNGCDMNYKITKNIPSVFHNVSSYVGHFIMKEIANEFDGELECLGEKTEKYISFSVKVNKKITKKDEDDNKKILNIPYRLTFIDS